jgi:Putative Ig domain
MRRAAKRLAPWVGAVALAACTVAPATAAAAPLAWGGSELTLPANAEPSDPDAVLHSVACGAAGSCAAVGRYSDAAAQRRAMVASLANGTWSAATELVLPPNADDTTPSPELTRVACGAAGSCAAVGNYDDDGGRTLAMVASQSSGSWSAAAELDLPSDKAANPAARLVSLACAQAGECTAVGSYDTDTGRRAMVASQANGIWSPATAVTPPDGASDDVALGPVACATADSCTAGGYFNDTSGNNRAMAVSQVNGTWSDATEIVLPGNAAPSGQDAAVYSVACATAASCTAVGYYRDTEGGYRGMTASQQTNGSWSAATEVPAPANAISPSEASLDWLACGAVGSCGATGTYNDASSHRRVMVASQVNGAWSAAAELTSPADADTADPERGLNAIACGGASSCAAVGFYRDNAGGNRPMAASQSAGTWSAARAVTLPDNAAPAASQNAALDAVACGAADSCTAVGSYKDAADARRALVAFSAPALEVSTSALPGAQAGSPYSAQVAATGGSDAPSWSIAAGSLPAGLSLDPGTGRISGTPTASGTSSFTVRASDPGPPAQAATTDLSIAVAPAPSLPPGQAVLPEGPPAAKRPVLAVKTTKFVVTAGAVRLKIACQAAPCSGTIKLTRVVKGKTIVLAKASYVLARGKTKTVSLRLTKAGKTALRSARTRAVKVKLAVSVRGGRAVTRTVAVR